LRTVGRSPEEMVGIVEKWLIERDLGQNLYESGGGI
jgi:bifunctional enzyme CysN/CysC